MADIVQIHDKLKKFNFVLIDSRGTRKKPLELNWPNKIHYFEDKEVLNHLNKGDNYGIMTGKTSTIDNNFLLVIDFDKKEFQDEIQAKNPELFDTFTTTSGSSKNCMHLWFLTNEEFFVQIKDDEREVLCDILCRSGKQIIGPNSTHASGSKYHVINDKDFKIIDMDVIKSIFLPYDKTIRKIDKIETPKIFSNTVAQQCIDSISMKEILTECSVDITKNPTKCPFHTSSAGACLSWNNEVLHCFHCQDDKRGWNKFSFLKECKNFTSKEAFEWFAKKADKFIELRGEQKKYTQTIREESARNEFFSMIGQAREFMKFQPVYYERKGQFWIWDFEKFCWVEKDETDLLNLIRNKMQLNTIDSKVRNEILEAIKEVGRENKPEEIKPTWVQYKDTIYDIETDEEFQASPKYFVANPINWKLGKNEDTPKIDELFKSWVDVSDIPKLEEFAAFITIPQYFIHSFIFLVGPPGTAKSTYVNFLSKFIGDHNCAATSIDRINNNTRFETKNWHKKLLIRMSEVSDIYELKNSGLINQATGGDPLAAEIKGGATFNFINYAKFIYPTNKLLKVDSTDGFGRRARDIRFNNRFEKEKEILNEISEIEFENFARKCLRIAKHLWKERRFSGDVDISERMKHYQEISKTPIEKFIDDFCDITDSNAKTKFDEFYLHFCNYLRTQKIENISKITVGRDLRKMGFENRRENWKIEQTSFELIEKWEAHNTIFGLKLSN